MGLNIIPVFNTYDQLILNSKQIRLIFIYHVGRVNSLLIGSEEYSLYCFKEALFMKAADLTLRFINSIVFCHGLHNLIKGSVVWGKIQSPVLVPIKLVRGEVSSLEDPRSGRRSRIYKRSQLVIDQLLIVFKQICVKVYR